MKKMKNRLDEMQEQKLLKIEHYGVWFVFWALLAAIMIQTIIYGPGEGMKCVAGEWSIFMALALYLVIACIRNGIWDRHLAPSPKVNLAASFLGGLAAGLWCGINAWVKYEKPAGAAAAGVFMGVGTAVLCFIALSISCALYKKRRNQLEAEEEKDL